MSLYSDTLPPGFNKPVTLKNLVDVLEHLRNQEQSDIASLETIINSLISKMNASPITELDTTQSDVTTNSTPAAFAHLVRVLAVQGNSGVKALAQTPLTAVGATLDDVTPDFWAREEARLTARLIQQQHWQRRQQTEAVVTQKIIQLEQKFPASSSPLMTPLACALASLAMVWCRSQTLPSTLKDFLL